MRIFIIKNVFVEILLDQLQEAENKQAKRYYAIQFKLMEIRYFV